MKRKIMALVAVLVLVFVSLPAHAETSLYADILHAVAYGEDVTYVIGHKSPDADTIGSAIAYAALLRELGINAEAAATAKVNQETQFALDFFGMEQPQVLADAAGKQFVLVDHSEYSQALSGMKDARVVGIVDHHGIGDVRTTEPIAVRSLPAGAASSIVWLSYRECGVEVSRDAARAMLMGILSDTVNMTNRVRELDLEAYHALLPVAEIEDIDALYEGMTAAKLSYAGMTDSEIFYSDYKEYLAGEYTFGIGIVETDTEENILNLSQRMQDALPKIYATNNLDMLFCMVIISGKTTRLIWYGEDAEAAVRESFPEYDGSGFLVFTPSVSRKAIIVPALTATLEKWSPAKE